MTPAVYDIIVITGATASGKTGFAALLANRLNAEIISADSRQVYRNMDIGTGKDYKDYIVKGNQIPYHLVDIVDAGNKYNVYEYQKDFHRVYKDLIKRKVLPVICGGSGMYIDSVISGYRLVKVPSNPSLRANLDLLSMDELARILGKYKKLHNITDIDSRKRAVRAIEIEEYFSREPEEKTGFPELSPLVIGIKFDRDSRRKRISDRLRIRLDQGMVDEVKNLLDSGIDPEVLIYYGLEYKYICRHLLGELSYEEMSSMLETAIHQFAKRQMTWFRGMERKGLKIHWLDGYMPEDEKLARALSLFESEE